MPSSSQWGPASAHRREQRNGNSNEEVQAEHGGRRRLWRGRESRDHGPVDVSDLEQALATKVKNLIRDVVNDATVLEVRTFAAEGGSDLTKVKYDASQGRFASTADGVSVNLRALTAIEFDGDINADVAEALHERTQALRAIAMLVRCRR
jgi:uncharacterized protein (UPF0147 family)